MEHDTDLWSTSLNALGGDSACENKHACLHHSASFIMQVVFHLREVNPLGSLHEG